MVWISIASREVSHLTLLKGNINTAKYHEAVLIVQLLLTTKGLFERDTSMYTSQQDGGLCHKAKSCLSGSVIMILLSCRGQETVRNLTQ